MRTRPARTADGWWLVTPADADRIREVVAGFALTVRSEATAIRETAAK